MKNRKKFLLILIIFEILIALVPLALDIQGFNNGRIQGHFPERRATFNPNFATESEIQDWYRYCYGTHDWIAEAALDAILADQIASAKWKDDDTIFWTEKRKVIFYIGTEAPDTTDNPEAKSYTYLTLNNIPCHGMLVKTKMYFHTNDASDNRMKPKSYNKFVTDCYTWTYKARNYLREGKCDAAAFYMGAITHLIADVASWPHVLDWREVTPQGETSILGGLHKDYEDRVHDVTKDHYTREKEGGFTYPKSFPIGTAMASEPVAALELVAFDTRWDYDMSWVDMYTTPFPSYITPGEYPATRQYTVYSRLYFEEPVSNWGQPFKTRVQENLNKAVKYCAYAINYIADAWAEGDNPKYCEECSGNDNPYQEKSFSKGTRVLRYLSILLILGITNAFFLPYLPIIERYLFAS